MSHDTLTDESFYHELARLDEALCGGGPLPTPTDLDGERWQRVASVVHALDQFRHTPPTAAVAFNWSDDVAWFAAQTKPRTDPLHGLTQLGRYRLEGIVGRGGMGVVYRAWDTDLARSVAIKVLHSAGAADSALPRFRAEASLLAQLSSPHIVQVYEIGTHLELPFLVLELVNGPSLRDHLRTQPLTDRLAAKLLLQLAQAVQAAHTHGIIHRDLKPANVLLHPEAAALGGFVPKLTDFGLAKRVDHPSGLTQSGYVVGTPAYMAPEQAQGRPDVGPLADVYGLGAILYECLTGRPPFFSAVAVDLLTQVIINPPVPPRQLQPNISPDLDTICLKCLEKPPTQRYASAQALADDLHRFLSDQPIQGRPISRREHAWRWCKRHPREAAWIGAFVSVMVLAFVVSWGLTTWALGNAEVARHAEQQADEQRQHAVAHAHTASAAQAHAERLRAQAEADVMTIQQLQSELREKVRTFFVTISTDELLREPNQEPLRKRLLTKAKDIYGDLLQRATHSVELRFEQVAALVALADVQAELGETTAALQLFAQAEVACTELQPNYPHPAQVVRLRARARAQRGLLLYDRDATAAAQAIPDAVADYRAAVAATDAAELQQEFARFLMNVGVADLRVRQLERAEHRLTEAAQRFEALAHAAPTHVGLRALRTNAVLALVRLATARNQPDVAQQQLERALRLARAVVQDFPDHLEGLQVLAHAQQHQCDWLLFQGQTARARTACRELCRLRTQIHHVEPHLVSQRHALARAHWQLAQLVESAEERQNLTAICALLQPLEVTESHTPGTLLLLADACSELARLQRATPAVALLLFEQAERHFRALPDHPIAQKNLGGLLCNRAVMHYEHDRPTQAFADIDAAITLLRRAPASVSARPFLVNCLSNRAYWHQQQRNFVAAVADWEELTQLQPNLTGAYRARQMTCWLASGQLATARNLVPAVLAQTPGPMLRELTQRWLSAGEPSVALQLWRQAYARGERTPPADLRDLPTFQAFQAEVAATETLARPPRRE